VTGAQNIDALFFMLVWARCGFQKKHSERHYVKLVFLYLMGSIGHILHYSASEARNVDALCFILGWARCGFHKKTPRETLSQTCVFVFGGIYGACSAFRCVRGAKRRCTIFMLGWSLFVRINTCFCKSWHNG
jgi:hypothetical protein